MYKHYNHIKDYKLRMQLIWAKAMTAMTSTHTYKLEEKNA